MSSVIHVPCHPSSMCHVIVSHVSCHSSSMCRHPSSVCHVMRHPCVMSSVIHVSCHPSSMCRVICSGLLPNYRNDDLISLLQYHIFLWSNSNQLLKQAFSAIVRSYMYTECVLHNSRVCRGLATLRCFLSVSQCRCCPRGACRGGVFVSTLVRAIHPLWPITRPYYIHQLIRQKGKCPYLSGMLCNELLA